MTAPRSSTTPPPDLVAALLENEVELITPETNP